MASSSRFGRTIIGGISRHIQQPKLTNVRQLGTIRPTTYLQEKISMKVPTMGDSITEGTIVEWTVGIGEAVKEGDVIVLVETDKVTIDIKADMDGVITQHFGAVDDNVEVGADLYQIDTEGVATAVTTAVTTAVADNESSTKEEISNTTEVSSTIEEVVSKSDESVRNPSIHFLGKEGWKDKLTVVAKSLPQIAQPLKPNGAITLDGGHLTPMYGRLPFSEREMEALMMGGASEAPFDQM